MFNVHEILSHNFCKLFHSSFNIWSVHVLKNEASKIDLEEEFLHHLEIYAVLFVFFQYRLASVVKSLFKFVVLRLLWHNYLRLWLLKVIISFALDIERS